MPQSLAKVAIHVVYSTKGRQPWLQSVCLRNELYAYMATILRDKVDSPAIVIGGMPDHIHVLGLLSRKFPIMSVIKESKTETSKWLKKQSPDLATFAWQGGYGAFSVSESNIPQVRKYIEEQEHYHHRMTFQDEFRALCRRHGLELDERYAWIRVALLGLNILLGWLPRALPWADIGLVRWAGTHKTAKGKARWSGTRREERL